jgi:hypothetical protein
MDINPYESPREPGGPPTAEGGSAFAGMTAKFTVHTPEPHEVEVYCSRWTGLEVYHIDGVLRLRTRSFGLSAVRKFEVEDEDRGKHELEITVKAFPWWSGSASLDGKPVVGELFSTERRDGIVGFVIVAVILLALAAWGLLGALRLSPQSLSGF